MQVDGKLNKQQANQNTKQIVKSISERMASADIYNKSLEERINFVRETEELYLEQIQSLLSYYLEANQKRFEVKNAESALLDTLEKLTNLILFAQPQDTIVEGRLFTAEEQKTSKKERPYTTESNEMAVMNSRESLTLDDYLESADTNEGNTTKFCNHKINMEMVKKHMETKEESKQIIDSYLHTGIKTRQIVEDYNNSNENEQLRFVCRKKHPKIPVKIENVVSNGVMTREMFIDIQRNIDSPEYKHYDKTLFKDYRLKCNGDLIYGVEKRELVEVPDARLVANIKKAVGMAKNCVKLDQDCIDIYKAMNTMIFFKKISNPAFKALNFKMDFTNESAVRNLIRLGFFTGASGNFDVAVDELLRIKTACQLNENEEKVFSVYSRGKCNGGQNNKEYDDCNFTKNIMTHKMASELLGISERLAKKQIDNIAYKITEKYKEAYEDNYKYMVLEKGEYKKCNKCGENKLVSKFSNDAKSKDGLKNICKKCQKEKKI